MLGEPAFQRWGVWGCAGSLAGCDRSSRRRGRNLRGAACRERGGELSVRSWLEGQGRGGGSGEVALVYGEWAGAVVWGWVVLVAAFGGWCWGRLVVRVWRLGAWCLEAWWSGAWWSGRRLRDGRVCSTRWR